MSSTMSPTQITLYLQDPSAWAARYVARSKRYRPVVGDFIGGDVHRLLARYLRGEVAIEPPGPTSSKWGSAWHPHAIAAQGLEHLPEPGTVDVEVRRVFDVEGVSVVCIKDAERPGLIVDHKTGSVDSAVEDLITDVQAVIYAAEHLHRTGRDSVTLRWIWYDNDGRGSVRVEQEVGLDNIKPTISVVRRAIHDMEADRWAFLISSQDSTISGARTSRDKKTSRTLPLI